MNDFWEPEPRRSGLARWLAFALAVFLLFGAGGALAAIATGGRLDLSALGIRLPFVAETSPTPIPSGAGGPADRSPEPSDPNPGATDGRPTDPPGSAPASPDGSPGSSLEPGASAPATPVASPQPNPSGGPVITGAVDPALSARLQKALETARKRLILPGVSASIVFADGSTWTGVSGFAVPATKERVRPETPFAIASVTKTFTAALILRLAEQGKLGLDDRLAKYVPSYPDASKLTITMLLRQTSGLQDYFQDGKFDKAITKNRTRTWTAKAVLAFHPEYFNTVVFQPAEGWHYSNTNYLLLGLVAEKAGGAPWATLVRRELLEPLGLRSVFVQGVEEPRLPVAHANRMYVGAGGKVLPSDLGDGTDIVPFTSVVTAAGAAGAMAADSPDLATWARALYGGDVLTPESTKLMLTFDPKIAKAYATAYGMGVSRVKFDRRTAYGHTGALAGTRSAIRWFPKERLAIAALFNRDGYFRGDDVIRYLVRVLYPPPPSPSPSARPAP